MGKKFEPLLWRIYARVYDSILLRFLPYRRLLDLVANNLNPAVNWKILDAGCGTGNLLARIARSRSEIQAVGIDFSPAMLSRAQVKLKENRGVTLREGDLNYPLPFAAGEFDAVVCVNVLYAVDRPGFLLREIYRVLKEGGRLLLVTPSYQPKMSRIFSEHVRELRKRNPFFWPVALAGQITALAPAVIVSLIINGYIQQQQSFHFFQDQELQSLVGDAGFTVGHVEKVYGAQCLFLTGTKDSSQEDVASIFQRERWAGLA